MPSTVFITGASSGIGRALALELGARGHKLGLFARRADRLAEVAAALPNCHVAVEPLDVDEPEHIAAAFDRVAQVLGGVDAVVANAGIIRPRRTGTGTFASDHDTIRTNLIGAMATVDAAVDLFRARGNQRGHVLGVSSLASLRGMPHMAAYCASKAGFSTYLEAIREELRGDPIAVTTLLLGFVDTDISDNMDRYPFVITAAAAARHIADCLATRPATAVVPRLPWRMLAPVVRVAPMSLVARFF